VENNVDSRERVYRVTCRVTSKPDVTGCDSIILNSSHHMAANYELIPTADENEHLLESETEVDDDDDSTSQLTVVEPSQTEVTVAPDSRFYQPTPSPFKRAALLIFIGFLFWLAFSLRKAAWRAKKSPKIVHAHRYIPPYWPIGGDADVYDFDRE